MKTDIEFNRLARRVRWKRWLITIGIAVVVSFGLVVGGYQLLQHLAAKSSDRDMDYLQVTAEILAPNLQSSDRYLANTTIQGGQVVSHRYKEIAGQRVAWSPAVTNYSWLGTELGTAINATDWGNTRQDRVYDRITQQRVPQFYDVSRRPTKTDPRWQQDLATVARTSHQVAEVALTFKHPLTYAAIQRKLPRSLTAAWYWIGTKDSASPELTNDYLGIAGGDDGAPGTGRLTTTNYRYFRSALKQANREFGGTLRTGGLDVFKFGAQYAQRYPSLQTAKFAGVIVTGNSAAFKQLGHPDWVAASSAGIVMPQTAIQ